MCADGGGPSVLCAVPRTFSTGDTHATRAPGPIGRNSDVAIGEDGVVVDTGDAAGGESGGKLTHKERKRRQLELVGELKRTAERPDVVEVWDATAREPEFLVYLKSYRNTVPVPRHWSRKRKYLQGKRGVDKKPYELPDFIQATGIAKLREAHVEREEEKRLKQKTRERVQPKMGDARATCCWVCFCFVVLTPGT